MSCLCYGEERKHSFLNCIAIVSKGEAGCLDVPRTQCTDPTSPRASTLPTPEALGGRALAAGAGDGVLGGGPALPGGVPGRRRGEGVAVVLRVSLGRTSAFELGAQFS